MIQLHLKKMLPLNKGFPAGSDGKEPAYNAGDSDLIPESPRPGRSSGEENGNPLQYSCLDNHMDSGAWWATVHGVTKSHTGLSKFHTHTYLSKQWQVQIWLNA